MGKQITDAWTYIDTEDAPNPNTTFQDCIHNTHVYDSVFYICRSLTGSDGGCATRDCETRSVLRGPVNVNRLVKFIGSTTVAHTQ